MRVTVIATGFAEGEGKCKAEAPTPVAAEAGDEESAPVQDVDKSFEDILAIFNRGSN